MLLRAMYIVQYPTTIIRKMERQPPDQYNKDRGEGGPEKAEGAKSSIRTKMVGLVRRHPTVVLGLIMALVLIIAIQYASTTDIWKSWRSQSTVPALLGKREAAKEAKGKKKKAEQDEEGEEGDPETEELIHAINSS